MIGEVEYCPILHSRRAEVNALFYVPAQLRPRMFPILVARPWPNASKLERLWEKVREATAGRRFGLDLDETRRSGPGRPEAVAAFAKLFDPSEGFRSYYEQVREIDLAVPVIRLPGGRPEQLNQQLDWIARLERGCLLIVRWGSPGAAAVLLEVLGTGADVSVVVDAGWGRDILGREVWATQLVRSVMEADPDRQIVLASSSFPETFASISKRGQIPAHERLLYSAVVRSTNAPNLIYGDWGSTRLPRPSQPMNIVPRIDIAGASEWTVFRQFGSEGYPDIAARALDDPLWPAQLDIWGTTVVKNTAARLPGAIKGQEAASAARINMHLSQQAQPPGVGGLRDGDEPYTDI
jgi:hypothetical protein